MEDIASLDIQAELLRQDIKRFLCVFNFPLVFRRVPSMVLSLLDIPATICMFDTKGFNQQALRNPLPVTTFYIKGLTSCEHCWSHPYVLYQRICLSLIYLLPVRLLSKVLLVADIPSAEHVL